MRISDWSSDMCSSDRGGGEDYSGGDDGGTIRLDATGDYETVTIKSSNTRILPSVNAIFEVAPNTLLRVAGYRAMSRPAPSALGAGRTFQIDADDFTSVEEAIGNVRANGSPRDRNSGG